jgi:hypothetical protein
MQKYVLALAFVAAPLSPAAAQDFFVYGGVELTYDIERDGAGTDNVAALYSYIEVTLATGPRRMAGSAMTSAIRDISIPMMAAIAVAS